MTPFTEDMFDSNEGMLTSVWGPAMWHVLHTISFNYPVRPSHEHKLKYYRFVLSIGDVLPCIHCRNNFKNNLRDVGFSKRCFKDRKHFSRFMFDLHNQVNRMLGKNEESSFRKVRERYEHFRSRCIDDLQSSTPVKQENGCIEPMYGKKSKCVIRIVPKNSKHRTFAVDKDCKLRRLQLV